MKKIVLIIASSFLGLGAFAQEGFHIGLKGGSLGTYMLNSDLSNTAGNFVESRVKFASSFAITTNYHFTETIGLGVDINFATLSQDYVFYKSNKIDATLDVSYLRIPLLLHFNSDPGSAVMFKGFFGPQISLMNGATMTNTYVKGSGETDPLIVTDAITGVSKTYPDRAHLNFNELNDDVAGSMESSTIGAILGLGFAINFTDYLNMEIGAVLGYDFTDAGNPFQTKEFNYTDSHFIADAPTNNITAGFNIGINYILAK